MFIEINAFGWPAKRGSGVRLSFDANMQRISDESKASFVVEVTLSDDGVPFLRMAGASRESGLLLRCAREVVPVTVGVSINLLEKMRSQPAELRHPGRPGKLELRPKVYGGFGHVLELVWRAGAVATPRPVASPTPRFVNSDFIPAGAFNRMASKGRRVDLGGGQFFLVFADQEDALAFGRYTSGFPRRIMPTAGIAVRTRWLDAGRGYIAELTCKFPGWERQYPGWATETGVIICNGLQVVGLGVTASDGNMVVVPLRAFSHTVRTESGTFYVLYEDGSAYCRSGSTGAQPAGEVAYFADYDRAKQVYTAGGAMSVTPVPVIGRAVVYLDRKVAVNGDIIFLAAGSFRRGTRVEQIRAA